MRSFFPRLLSLHGAATRQEDFLTEVMAWLFQTNQDPALCGGSER